MENPPEMTDFDCFWQAYPRRDAKKDALKAWRQLSPSAELVRAIIDALAWQIPLHRWNLPKNRSYVPLPASYLRGERFNDEAPQTASRTVQNASPDDIALGKAIREHHAQLAVDRAQTFQPVWRRTH